MFWTLIATTGMIAVGCLTWSLLSKQGYASPPTDHEDPPSDT